jgi:hypothetical protein
MALTISKEVQEAEKRKRMRSPAYPYINLETAIKRVREFYDKETRNPAPLKVAVKHWGYEEKSSGGLQTAAALISFGLMKDEGTGKERKLKLTERALQILLDRRPDSEQRANAIRDAALSPKIHQQLWRRFANTDVSEDTVEHFLILELKPAFNPSVAKAVIKEYRDTIAFAKPDESAIVPLVGGDLDAEIQEDSEVSNKGGDSSRDAGQGNRNPASKNSTMREDVFSLTEGKVVFQWPTPLSADSIADLKDWLEILQRKIARSTEPKDAASEESK